MGVIKKEGIKQSAVTYVGVLIGLVNTMYFYPKFFTEEELGLFRFLLETATLIYPFITLGIHNLSIRMFPTFKSPLNGHNGLFFLLLSGVIIGYIVFLVISICLQPLIDGFFASKSLYIQEYWFYVVPMAGLVVLRTISTQYILNFKKVLLPSVFNELFLKVGLPVIAILLYFNVLTIYQGVLIWLAVNGLIVICLFAYIIYLKEWHFKPNWSFLKKPIIKEMSVYSLYGILGSLGSIMATRIDVFMLAIWATDDLKAVGVYSIAMIIASVINVPAKAIVNISSPVIAQSWKEKDIDNIKTIYTKSSIILLSFGLLCLIGIWSSIDDIFALMPNGERYAIGKYVILILGIGKIFDLATGTNDAIIRYSKYFRFNFYAALILALLNVVSNLIFIPLYELNGAALATATSLMIFNISKSVYVYYRLGMHPFTTKSIQVLFIGAAAYGIGLLVIPTQFLLLNIILRSIVIAFSFMAALLYFKINEDISQLFWQSIDKVKSILKR